MAFVNHIWDPGHLEAFSEDPGIKTVIYANAPYDFRYCQSTYELINGNMTRWMGVDDSVGCNCKTYM